MREKKASDNEGKRYDRSNRAQRFESMPPTGAKPPMPPVKPPKQK